ncbi:hypothetical protein [Candidatus Enterococcus ferrettii]|uniref:Lipoprotein n=1 Tax=Candidatus Enterococcus ferrettii TaxID=2815324 RepID=A0ABV0EJW1_9ENTE|nr:hypothetical protein [Enterococcus sp. 665A]MBO1338268.1 hypothetical protein [Enterococcus sp. 665A]
MRKRNGLIVVGFIVFLFILFGMSSIGKDSSVPAPNRSSGSSSSSSASGQPVESNSTLLEESSSLEGYYWEGYLDQREKFQNPLEEKEYKDILFSSELTDAIAGSGYMWYRVDDVVTEIPDGSYVKVTYEGPILEVYPAIFAKVVKVEILE